MQGTISVQGQQLPFNMQMDQTLSWRVESVDSDGTATVAVTAKTDSAVFNGQAAPVVPTQTTRIRVAKDGRILSAGFQITDLASNSDLGSLVPGSDQFMPLLPDHPVEVGDTWTKSFDQEMPFGMGRLRYDVESSLLRYEMVDRNRYAVLFSRFSLPLDMTIDLRKVLAASGTAGQILPGGVNPKMKFGGTMNMQQTAWFDQAHGELDRTSADATFDMTIEFADFPQQAGAPAGAMKFSGTMNLQVQRLESTLKLSPKELKALRASQNRKAQTDLRNALAAAKVHFGNATSYEGFTPAVANKIETSLAFNRTAKARIGQVSIRVASKAAILLVTRSATGKIYCLAQRAGKKVAYGTRDARTVADCTGGW
jgi:type IV pilus assembly protein PilA